MAPDERLEDPGAGDPPSRPTSSAAGSARRWLTPLVALAAALTLGALFATQGPVVGGVLRRLPLPLSAALATLIASLGWARAFEILLGRSAAPTDATIAGTARRVVVGLPLHGTVCFVVGLASTHPVAMAAPLAAGMAIGLVEARRLGVALRARPRPPAAALGAAGLTAVALVAGCLGVATAMALLPPSSLDEIAYHLSVPRQWVVEGRVVAYPLNSHSFFPFGVEAASLPWLALLGANGALASHLAHVLSAAAVLVVAHDFVARRASRAGAWIAVAAIATTPALLWSAGRTLTDWALLGVAIVLADALDRGREEAGDGWRVQVALALGAGLVTKYTFAPVAAVALGAYAIAAHPRGSALRRLAPFVLGGAALGAPFLIRNLVSVGNPLAPFGDPITPHVAFFGDDAGAADLLTSYVYGAAMVEESLGLSLAVAALALVTSWRHLEGRFAGPLVVGLSLGLAAFAALRPVGRILLPWMALLALFGVVAAERGLGAGGPRALYRAAALAAAGLQALLLASLFAHFDPLAAVATPERERAFLEGDRDTYAVARWMDAHLPPSSTTLLVGLHEQYWFTHRVRGGGNFDGPRVAALLDAGSPDALDERLRAARIDHVALYRNHLLVAEDASAEGLTAERTTTLTPAQASLLRAFLDEHTSIVAASDVAVVHRLEEAPDR